MCGLAGLICWDERFRVTAEMLGAMSARIAHRGPDAAGAHLDKPQRITPQTPQAALAHRRLSILDLDPRANQPFGDAQGRLIIFNGEIYNFRELRAEIRAAHADFAWRTNCDTEVLLAAYSTWGRDCLSRLNGMFAFAIWEPDQRRLFLARDRMGQKPFYFAYDRAGAFAFASEPRALRVLPWIDAGIRIEALVDYLTWGCTPRGTIFRGIDKLAPASWMSLDLRPSSDAPGDSAVISSGTYFDANAPEQRCSVDDGAAIERTRALVLESVRRQLVSDVPLGCFLSGGIDSSIIAAAMRMSVPKNQPVLTFSIGFDDPRYDETEHAAAVARHVGSEHRQFVVRPDAASDLPRLAEVFGEPFGDSSALPTHYLSQQTRQFVKVALSGDGGDELFGGYDRYRAMAIAQRMPAALFWLLRPLTLLPGNHPKSRLARLKRLVHSAHLPPALRYASYPRLFDARSIAELLRAAADVRSMIEAAERELVEPFEQLQRGGRDVVGASAAVDRVLYLPEDLLTKVDRCSMLHALEVRSPFMDHELVHFAAGLSGTQLLSGWGKGILKRAFAGEVPPGILRRKKMGFAVPIGQWLRTSLREMLIDLVSAGDSFAARYFDRPTVRKLIDEHQERRADHSQRLYALLMLELWWRSARV